MYVLFLFLCMFVDTCEVVESVKCLLLFTVYVLGYIPFVSELIEYAKGIFFLYDRDL